MAKKGSGEVHVACERCLGRASAQLASWRQSGERMPVSRFAYLVASRECSQGWSERQKLLSMNVLEMEQAAEVWEAE